MDRTWKIFMPALAVGLQLICMAAAQADPGAETIKTETTTQGAPEVIKSFMVPTMTQTKEVTDSSGDTTKTTAPMIMERHEQVVVPQEKTTSETTIQKTPAVVEETTTEQKLEQKVATPKKVVHTRACTVPRHHISHRVVSHPQHQIAESTNISTVKRTVIEQPTVIQHTERTDSNPIIYERKDPALQ